MSPSIYVVSCAPGIGDVTDSSTWQTLGGSGVADYLSTLPLPLHHLLKYSTPITNIVEKREEQPTIVTAVNTNGLNVMPNIATVGFLSFYSKSSGFICL